LKVFVAVAESSLRRGHRLLQSPQGSDRMIKFAKLRLVIVEVFDKVNHFECVARYLNQRLPYVW
jgi:hypothetical protein